jgi:hypothetical protein
MKNIYDIIEEMKITRAEVEVNLCCESLTYITEGDGVISKVITFIKNLIKKFTDFLKNIVRSLTGGGGGGGGAKEVTASGVGDLSESGEYIKIYRGMQSLSQFSSAVFKMVDTIKDAKEKFQYRIEDDADDYTIKDLQKYYKMQLGLPLDKEFNKDAFILKMRGDAGLEEVVEIKPSMYDRDFIDNFIDEEVDYITERIEKVRKNANDTATKMIKEIEAQENYKQRDILNLKTYVAAMTHLFGAYQYVRTILLKSHATICNTLDRIKK